MSNFKFWRWLLVAGKLRCPTQTFCWREGCMTLGWVQELELLEGEWGRDAQCCFQTGVVRDQMWISGVPLQGWRVYGGNKKHSEEASGERRKYFFQIHATLPGTAVTWLCLELNQSKFTNVGFFRCGLSCFPLESFPDSRFLRFILSEFHSYIFGSSAACHSPTV